MACCFAFLFGKKETVAALEQVASVIQTIEETNTIINKVLDISEIKVFEEVVNQIVDKSLESVGGISVEMETVAEAATEAVASLVTEKVDEITKEIHEIGEFMNTIEEISVDSASDVKQKCDEERQKVKEAVRAIVRGVMEITENSK